MHRHATHALLSVVVLFVLSLTAWLATRQPVRQTSAVSAGAQSGTDVRDSAMPIEESENCNESVDQVAKISDYAAGFFAATRPHNGEELLVDQFTGCVCAQIRALATEIEPHDNLDSEGIVDRIQLLLDDEPLQVVAVSEPFTDLIISDSRWPANASATVPDVFGVCWQSNQLLPGDHEAQVIYTEASGEVAQHTWTFKLLP